MAGILRGAGRIRTGEERLIRGGATTPLGLPLRARCRRERSGGFGQGLSILTPAMISLPGLIRGGVYSRRRGWGMGRGRRAGLTHPEGGSVVRGVAMADDRVPGRGPGGGTHDVSRDQFVLIRVEGMHCHRCEQSIRKALQSHDGVREVEVDFASGQASVLFDRGAVTIRQLMDSVNEAGYRATGFTQSHNETGGEGAADAGGDAKKHADRASHPS